MNSPGEVDATSPVVVDGIRVDRSVAPRSAEELSAFLRDSEGPVAFVGGGTELHAGNPLGPVETVVRTAGMDRVTEYVPSDLTIHVEAGVRVDTLMEVLSEHDQLLPLDPWNGPDATIGGIVATDAQGPLRTVGTVRDWIIGMKVVHADGRISKAGGRVVKNVSGYDLPKLYTGSLGSLAAIAEISFKLRAAWETTASACLRIDDPVDASRITREIRLGPVEPISLVWYGPPDTVAVRFGHHPDAVDWQMKALPPGDWMRMRGTDEEAFWDGVRRKYQAMPAPMVRVIAQPSEVAAVIRDCRPDEFLAHAAIGSVLMSIPSNPDTLFTERLQDLRTRYPSVIERADVEDRRKAPTFGVSGVMLGLMQEVKRSFDPRCRLNPGRHVDGELPTDGPVKEGRA